MIPFRGWGPKNSSHNGRKSQGITPESLDGQPPPSPHNPPSPLPPSRGEAASSNGRKSQGITPESLDGQPPPSPHNPPSPLPPSRGEAASSKGRIMSNGDPGTRQVDYILLAVGILLMAVPLVFDVMEPWYFYEVGLYLRLFASLGGALVGGALPGILQINFVGIRAVGALAVLALFWLVNPPLSDPQPSPAHPLRASAGSPSYRPIPGGPPAGPPAFR